MKLCVYQTNREKLTCTIKSKKLFLTQQQLRWLRKLSEDRGALCKRRFFNQMVFSFHQRTDLENFVETFKIDALGV